MSLFPTFLAPVTKLSRAVKERGWKGVLTQLYVIGDLKFGDLKGVDRFGNKYYENVELPYGQHRWVEYSNIHNPDSSQIPPE
jgi:NADH:ubiquinone oxidoreductase subunit